MDFAQPLKVDWHRVKHIHAIDTLTNAIDVAIVKLCMPVKRHEAFRTAQEVNLPVSPGDSDGLNIQLTTCPD